MVVQVNEYSDPMYLVRDQDDKISVGNSDEKKTL